MGTWPFSWKPGASRILVACKLKGMNVTIEKVDCQLFHIPLPQVLTDSMHGEMTHFGLVTVTIQDHEGAEGTGYTYTVGKTGGTAILSLLSQDLTPLLIGEDADRIDTLWEKMWWSLHFVGRGGLASFAIAAVDIALWDLKSRRANQPLWQFLGGTNPEVAAYAGGIDLQLPLDDLLRQTEQNLELGFQAIKMKVGRELLAEDVQRVSAMRTLLGPDIPLMVDANMRWTVDEAILAAQAFADQHLYWLEEPTIPEDFTGHHRIQAEGGIPVASGENLHTVYEFEKLIAAGGAAFPEPDVANIGGITAWLKVAHHAEAWQLPVTSHGVHDLHVHLLSAIPNASYLEVHGFGLERFLESPLVIAEGQATAPGRPGHGVQFKWPLLEKHQVARSPG